MSRCKVARAPLIAAAALWVAACSADGNPTPGSGAPSLGGGGTLGGAGTVGAAGLAGGFGNGSAGIMQGAAGTAPIGPSGMGCATADIQTARKHPTVALVIDGSGSMCDQFNGATRWQALRAALMDPDGVVPRLQTVVDFGMAIYDGLIDLAAAGMGATGPACALNYALNQPAGKECPGLILVGPAPNNFMTMDAAYPATELGGSTPTHKALTALFDDLIPRRQAQPDQMLNPTYVILATDGQPNDYCVAGSTVDAAAEVIAQVTRGAQAGIPTFVISLAGGDAALQAHLQQVAMAGGTGQPPFTPMNRSDLVNALVQIVGGAVGCDVFLNGKVAPGSECLGFVEVNGVRLPCGDPNGWTLKDERTISLVGQACTDFLSNPMAMLHADFPCGVFIPD